MDNIVIINNECFRDTDIPIGLLLERNYNVDYYILLDKDTHLTKDSIQKMVPEGTNLKIHYLNGFYRRKSLNYFRLLFNVLIKIRKRKPKVILTGIKEDLWGELLLPFFFKKRMVYMLHDAQRHPISHFSFSNFLVDKLDNFFLLLCNRFILFSKEQKEIFNDRFPQKKSIYILKPLQKYGQSSIDKPSIEKECKFLFFGWVSYYKGIDLLIDAFENVSKKVSKNISLSIYGRVGDNWQEWTKHIKTASLYNMQIRFFEDSEVPEIFQSHHYLVLPYRQVTQSGPFSVALEYGLPTIASNIGIFSNIISNEKNGFLFTKESVSDLEKCLEKALHYNEIEYQNLSSRVCLLKDKLYDEEKTLAKLEKIINLL